MLLFLEKFGIPIRPLNVIKNLYIDFEIEIKLEKYKNNIPYTSGVKQDDNLPSILIIIVMQILAEALENKWKESKISLTKCFHNSNIYITAVVY